MLVTLLLVTSIGLYSVLNFLKEGITGNLNNVGITLENWSYLKDLKYEEENKSWHLNEYKPMKENNGNDGSK